eukprot:RCo039985
MDAEEQKMLAKIKEAFLEDEPEWAEGYRNQEKGLSKKELAVITPKLNDIFWRLADEGEVDVDEIKSEIEVVFQQLRTERCKGDLREKILPLVKALPPEHHQTMLTDILELFSDLMLSDAEVLAQASSILVTTIRRMGGQVPMLANTQRPGAADAGEGAGPDADSKEKKKKKKKKDGESEEGAASSKTEKKKDKKEKKEKHKDKDKEKHKD